MSNTVTYTINLSGNANTNLTQLGVIGKKVNGIIGNMKADLLKFGDCAFAINNVTQRMNAFVDSINQSLKPGIDLNTSMSDLSAITGITGEKLKEIEGYARKTAKTFGGSAAQGVESYKLILSQLGPEIAKTPAALKMMGENISVLSKTMGGNTTAAAETLTTAMNQFQVSLDDPMQAAYEMSEMMNIMAAAAKEGSAELPAIKAALEQSGMAAKAAGVSFSETNSAIQVLDKAGKKGAEGGVALRNVMAILSTGRFLPKDVQEELKAAGVDINVLTDKSLSLTDRLRPLNKVMGDSALITKLFGRENNNAALALLSGLDTVDQYNKAIQGTNTAFDQAGIIMESYVEKQSRISAWFDNIKISIFNLTQSALPAFDILGRGMTGLGNIFIAVNAANCFWESATAKAIGKKTKEMYKSLHAMTLSSALTGIYTGVLAAATIATHTFAIAIKSLTKAIYNIPIVGWILAIIGAIIAAIIGIIKIIKHLWNNCEGFRKILFAVWEVVKAVFYNIGVVIKSLWNNIVKPYIMLWVNLFKIVGQAIWGAIKWCGEKIAAVFSWVFEKVGAVAAWISEKLTAVFTWVSEKAAAIFAWFSTKVSGIGAWLSEKILTPVKKIFTKIWDFVKGIIDKIISAMGKIFEPIKKLWNTLFPKEQFKDLGEAAKTGLEKGKQSFAESKKKHDEDEPEYEPKDAPSPTGMFSPEESLTETGNDNTGVVPPGVAAQTETTVTGGSRSTNITISIKSLIENMIFQGGTAENRSDIERNVAQAIFQALNIAQSSVS